MHAVLSLMLVLAIHLMGGLLPVARAAVPPPMQEHFVINAQYRGGVNKSFKDLGRGRVVYRPQSGGRFGLAIEGNLKNPETGEIYTMKVDAEFQLAGRTIQRLSQKLDLNAEARRYESLLTHNLPFVFLGRYQPLPAATQAEEMHYMFDGRPYVLRYVPVEGSVEATLFEAGTMIGKLFLTGTYGRPPQGLVKARMVGPNHLVFSLVIDRRGGR